MGHGGWRILATLRPTAQERELALNFDMGLAYQGLPIIVKAAQNFG